uniref:Uncharacterized protein n=1 Tax=Cucumis melo TaxID=3656 RepID=A0A9I9E361_CUCME
LLLPLFGSFTRRTQTPSVRLRRPLFLSIRTSPTTADARRTFAAASIPFPFRFHRPTLLHLSLFVSTTAGFLSFIISCFRRRQSTEGNAAVAGREKALQ